MMNVIVSSIFLLVLLVLFLGIPLLIGITVYRDANRRGMNAVLWTLIAVLAPGFIGLILYLVVRSDHTALSCPQCSYPVRESYAVCPQCGTSLKASCLNCHQPLDPSWSRCASCGEPVPEELKRTAPPPSRDKGLGKILLAVLLIPLLLVLLLVGGLAAFRGTNTSSFGSVSGVPPEEFKNTPVVSDWLKDSAASGDGIYVLRHTGTSGTTTISEYLIYIRGEQPILGLTAMGHPQGLFRPAKFTASFQKDLQGSRVDEQLFQVQYQGSDNPVLEIQMDGLDAVYKETMTNIPLGMENLIPMKDDILDLFEQRVPYVGNNSAVSSLLAKIGMGNLGTYTLELKTAEAPYGLRVIYSSTAKPLADTDLAPEAIQILGLIENADYVEITDGTTTFRLDTAEASSQLGFDVKDLGKDVETLAEYLKGLMETAD